MNFKKIALATWERRAHFEQFLSLGCSFGLTTEFDVSQLYPYAKKTQTSFHALMCWNILTALNTQEVFRMGYNEQQELGIYDVLDGEITILDGSGQQMDSIHVPYDCDLHLFCEQMQMIKEQYRNGKKTTPVSNSVLLSCMPWFDYTALNFSMKDPDFFLHPMVSWGKVHEQAGNWMITCTIHAHHALCDGYHIHSLFDMLQELLHHPGEYKVLHEIQGAYVLTSK